MKKVSIVVPCHNEQDTIPIYFQTTEKVLGNISNIQREYWFIDDGSTDDTLVELKKLNNVYPKSVHYVSFSRNFGKEAAMYAGLNQVTGDYIVVMDADLQDPPELIKQMLKVLQDGRYDCVGTRRVSRVGEPVLRSFFANLFYKLINQISKTPIMNGARDYRMMTRQMVNAVLSLSEYNRFSKGIFSWVGFDTKFIDYQNVERVAGKTSWSFKKLFKYSIDGITDFSEIPLSIASWTGVVSFAVSLIGLIFIIFRAVLVPNSSVSGWASLVCIILFIGGIQLLCIGIVGKYIGKIYLQSKHRPIFIAREIK